MLSNQLQSLKEEINKKQKLLADYEQRLQQKDLELRAVKEKILDRDKSHIEHERTFINDLKQREESHLHLKQEIQNL